MPRRLRRGLAAVYALTARSPKPEEYVEIAPGLTVPRFVLDWSRSAPAEAAAILDRVRATVPLHGRSVLAVGRGAGHLGIEIARRGARHVVAADMAARLMALAGLRLAEHPSDLPVEIRRFDDGLAYLGGQLFDVVIASDAFRSYGVPRSSGLLEARVLDLARRLERGGHMAVRFGPPWKAPNGGGVDSVLPWAHLMFPEEIIFDEFRRVRRGSTARAFEDIGINRVTLARFRAAMRATDLECVSISTNVSERRGPAVLRALSRHPRLEEYLTLNVYGVWRRSERTA
ncbi:MAG: hypothetical protein M3373_03015 [Gemmatimonadota bacterium]|nr:hypothetical protein [Gemmatimonadota bacterium]